MSAEVMSLSSTGTPENQRIKDAMSFEILLSSPSKGAGASSTTTEVSDTGKTDDNDGGLIETIPDEAMKDSPLTPTPSNRDREPEVGDDATIPDAADTAPITATSTADALVVREFVCMNDEFSECRTGQYTLSLSRKVISNHFGRNKGCTRQIHDWPLFCRKHYQRATYKPDLWQRRKINLIARQLDVIENLHPGTTYDVSLKKSEMNRLNEYARKVSAGIPAGEAEAAVAPDAEVKAFQAPISVLRELQLYLGEKKLEDVKEIVALILDMLKKGETKEVPSIEFLPFFPGTRKATTKFTDKSSVSKKGAIKKPSRKN
ncbi:hypothetical protein CC78DRAFT_549467 [Lojkania enalia]|uniref:Uncharacterized protein n=1 Tax=Lojkania enalia TaxID=147567 RepID=A0A9P4JY75_9PLEO|nr:hypothetical protein CC78DRAFT_549467 [Didymosphaeria enalia]